MIADKEITREPKRTLPTISLSLVPYDIGILMTFQRNSNSCRFPSRTDLDCLDMMIIRMPEECKLRNDHLIFIFCFLAIITVSISSEVPGNLRHHILSFEDKSQISSFDIIFESTSHFFNFHRWKC